MKLLQFQQNDGERAATGFRDLTGDYGTRTVAIAFSRWLWLPRAHAR